MNDHLERELVQVLSDAADTAPLPDEDFAPTVLRRRRNRRRQRYALIAGGCATVLAAAVGVTAVNLAPPEQESAAPTTWSGDVPDFMAAPPIEQVWPDAIHHLPGKLPDGTEYAVEAVLGKDRYLVGPAGYGTVPGNLAVFDVRTGTVRVLSDLRPKAEAKAKDTEVSVLGVAGEYAVWTIGINPTSPQHSIEVWSAKVDGSGGAELLTTLDGSLYSRVVGLAGEHIALNRTESAGKTTFELLSPTGGTPREVPGSTGFTWIGLGPWVRSGEPSEDPDGELLNLLTGERRTWRKHAGDQIAYCDPVLCLGASKNGKWTAYRLDGSDYRELPYDYLPSGQNRARLTSQTQGRIGVWLYTGSDLDIRQVVWDRSTGKAGDVPKPAQPKDTLLQWTDSEKRVVVFDFGAEK